MMGCGGSVNGEVGRAGHFGRKRDQGSHGVDDSRQNEVEGVGIREPMSISKYFTDVL